MWNKKERRTLTEEDETTRIFCFCCCCRTEVAKENSFLLPLLYVVLFKPPPFSHSIFEKLRNALFRILVKEKKSGKRKDTATAVPFNKRVSRKFVLFCVGAQVHACHRGIY